MTAQFGFAMSINILNHLNQKNVRSVQQKVWLSLVWFESKPEW